jgi:hypothetical protein
MDLALGDLVGAGYRQGILWTLAEYPQGRRFYEATGWHASGEVLMPEHRSPSVCR